MDDHGAERNSGRDAQDVHRAVARRGQQTGEILHDVLGLMGLRPQVAAAPTGAASGPIVRTKSSTAPTIAIRDSSMAAS